jgi:hypothetical protein
MERAEDIASMIVLSVPATRDGLSLSRLRVALLRALDADLLPLYDRDWIDDTLRHFIDFHDLIAVDDGWEAADAWLKARRQRLEETARRIKAAQREPDLLAGRRP